MKGTVAATASVARPSGSRLKTISWPSYSPQRGNAIDVARGSLERVFEKPLDQGVQLPVLLADVQDVVVPAVLADEAGEASAAAAGFGPAIGTASDPGVGSRTSVSVPRTIRPLPSA